MGNGGIVLGCFIWFICDGILRIYFGNFIEFLLSQRYRCFVHTFLNKILRFFLYIPKQNTLKKVPKSVALNFIPHLIPKPSPNQNPFLFHSSHLPCSPPRAISQKIQKITLSLSGSAPLLLCLSVGVQSSSFLADASLHESDDAEGVVHRSSSR